ncbi:hypothetical protein HUN01_17195 [Nostoc edaphicum CCNP1411]|uniref:Uncharacterized protein n=1 Tax=Nostoc edaphicum CCNP1411 TaxID=1472755 RepID=A0A7D7LDN2_9NOSO|nr:hypothetical protein [Nostoc edaphicum]QMS89230.1 hypothetical protein HUN01_17195 [Nostoc edaphicum CCNP1411]
MSKMNAIAIYKNTLAIAQQSTNTNSIKRRDSSRLYKWSICRIIFLNWYNSNCD